MGSYNPAIPCCCNEEDSASLKLCCLSVTLQRECRTAIIDEGECTSLPGPPQIIEYTKNYRAGAVSEEECTCALWQPGAFETINQDGTEFGIEDRLISCEATFYPEIPCSSGGFGGNQCVLTPEDEDAQKACSGGDTICTNWVCAPCGPVRDGCTLNGPCTGIPYCEPKPCCEPPPVRLCCCRVIEDGCITNASCTVCEEETSEGSGDTWNICSFIGNCEQCDLDQNVLIVSPCDRSCAPPHLDTDPAVTCCRDCVTYYQDPSTGEILEACAIAKCITPPPCNPVPNLPLCSCDPPRVEPSDCLQITPRYGTIYNSAENNLMSGMIYDPKTNTYKQNRLFLFGYGYDKL